MSGLLPVAVYGLEVRAGDVMIPAVPDFPATFRITMAAIDPTAAPQHTGTANGDVPARATLKIIRQPLVMDDEDDSEGDSDEEDNLSALLGGAGDEDDDEDDESSSDDEEKNGGPSDPAKTKKARKEAAVEQLKKALAESNGDDEMDLDLVNGTSGIISKGKAKATDDDEGDEDDNEDDDEDLELEEFVICTLDPTKNYQQTIDLTVAENERVFFKVSGTHTIYLTGNYVVPAEDGHNHKHEIYDGEGDDDEDYDLSPDEDELNEDDESDELDGLGDPRFIEIGSDAEEETPKLVHKEKAPQKGKNKRAAEESGEEPASLDDIMAKSLKPAEPAANGEVKLSKKQLKKLKNNAGKAVPAAIEKQIAKKEEKATNDSPSSKGDKKVQFAKKLEQGPSSETKADSKKEGGKPTASLGVKVVDGVKIDDKKLGKGPAAKKGDKVGMRYIGKLKDGKVFDSNKKGKAFAFTLGSGDVIRGWDIGVAGLSVGGERRIVVPAHLAYGSKSVPGIPANSELTFDLKLIEIR